MLWPDEGETGLAKLCLDASSLMAFPHQEDQREELNLS